jgi:response regulator RpfG family c-di-GMP phosphodiesterase
MLRAAPLHDVGKIGVPDSILLKPGALTEEEFEIIKTHSSIGWSILNKSSSKYLKLGAEIALCHHEKWDGSGYPDGLRGHDIPLSGRIVCIADVFDALRSDRPYKKAVSHKDAMSVLMEGKGTHFDPDLVDLVISNSEELATIYRRYGSGSTE